MSGHAGGWPLTVFLTPDQVPIFTGTYFPKERRYGMPAFHEVLTAVDEYYRGQPEEIRERGRRLIDALGSNETGNADDFAKLSRAPFETARDRLEQSYDSDHGGFGVGQKFPHPTTLALLLSQWHARPSGAGAHTLAMVTKSLDCMAERGLYDHLGGGFFRYSVDRFWSIPHFEKMLYDNAQLLSVYSDAYAATGKPHYASVASAHGRLGHARHARPARRLLLDARRRFRARGRQVLRLDAGRARHRARRGSERPRAARLRPYGRRQLRGQALAPLSRRGAGRRRRGARARRKPSCRRRRAPRGANCSRRANSACGPAATRSCWSPGTAS